MKKIACALLLTGGITGCFSTQPEGGLMESFKPVNQIGNPFPKKLEQASPRTVTAEQVTPNNARQMADALLQEMDRPD